MMQLDPHSATPPFEQLRSLVIDNIAAGVLIVGSRLPTVRKMADDLGIAPNTVARAYRELEADGFIETRGRNGTFIKAQSDSASQQAQLAAQAFAARVRELGVAPDVALGFARTALGEQA